MNNIERREMVSPLELRDSPADSKSPGIMAGYAAVFKRDSVNLGGFVETIAPGAFGRSLRSADVICNRNHDDDVMLGRTSSGTCRITEDATGLAVECDLPDTSAGRDTAVSLARRDFNGMSFAFVAVAEQWDWSIDPPLRTLLDVDLYDVSVVGRPAYGDTSVALRAVDATVALRSLAAAKAAAAAATIDAAPPDPAASSPAAPAASSPPPPPEPSPRVAPPAAAASASSPPAAAADLRIFTDRLRLLELAGSR